MIPKETRTVAAQAMKQWLADRHYLPPFKDETFEELAESALAAALSAQWRGIESAEWITAYNAGLEAAARHCEYNALSAIPVEIRGLKRTPKPAP